MKIEHYGENLKAKISEKGYKKNKIAEVLDISTNTLRDRLEDGNFTREQLLILVAKGYL